MYIAEEAYGWKMLLKLLEIILIEYNSLTFIVKMEIFYINPATIYYTFSFLYIMILSYLSLLTDEIVLLLISIPNSTSTTFVLVHLKFMFINITSMKKILQLPQL